MAGRGSTTRRFAFAATAIAGATAMLLLAASAAALFSATVASGPGSVATATMLAASTPSAAQVSCRANGKPTIEVSWAASGSSYVSGYAVERASASGGPWSVLANVGAEQRSYLDSGGSLSYSSNCSRLRTWSR